MSSLWPIAAGRRQPSLLAPRAQAVTLELSRPSPAPFFQCEIALLDLRVTNHDAIPFHVDGAALTGELIGSFAVTRPGGEQVSVDCYKPTLSPYRGSRGTLVGAGESVAYRIPLGVDWVSNAFVFDEPGEYLVEFAARFRADEEQVFRSDVVSVRVLACSPVEQAALDRILKMKKPGMIHEPGLFGGAAQEDKDTVAYLAHDGQSQVYASYARIVMAEQDLGRARGAAALAFEKQESCAAAIAKYQESAASILASVSPNAAVHDRKAEILEDFAALAKLNNVPAGG